MMIDYEKEDYKKALSEQYKSLNLIVGDLLLVENATEDQVDDLSYYNRKLAEARLALKRVSSKSKLS